MYNFLTKNGQTISFVVGALIVVLFYAMAVNSGDYETFSTMDLDGVKDPARYDFGLFDFGLMVTVALIVIGAVLMLGFGIFHVLTNLKGSIAGIAGLAVIAIIFGIGYSTSVLETEGPVYYAAQKFEVSDGERRIIAGSIYTGVALIGLAVVGIIVSEIRNFFK